MSPIEDGRHHLQRQECSKHGLLASNCDRCADATELEALRAENAELREYGDGLEAPFVARGEKLRRQAEEIALLSARVQELEGAEIENLIRQEFIQRQGRGNELGNAQAQVA